MEKSIHALRTAMLLLAVIMCAHHSSSAQGKSAAVLVPFVGCEADGQGGPVDPPRGRTRTVLISARLAQRLAYYKMQDGAGVLAPRGWHCFGTYGSNGASLYVSPDPIKTADLFSTSSPGFAGPVIQVSFENGATSGRFAVAKTIARVFPAHKDFVEAVIAENIEPADSFPYGPYPGDVLKYRSKDVVEFTTPADAEGLGTASRLRKNASPISGVAILLGEEPNILKVCVRLPAGTGDLTEIIIHQAELDADYHAE